jgi:hypothetical protein
MAITITDSAATIGTTEYSLPAASTTLTAQTTVCKMQAFIDFANMIAGDQYRVRVYETINGGSQLVIDEAVLTGVQPGPYVTPVLFVGNGWNVTVKKLAGTDRSVAWSLRKDNSDANLLTWLGSTPTALSFGRVDATVGSMQANVMTAAAAAADLTTELQSGLATAANVTTSTSTITALLPAALVGGRMDASVGAMAANTMTAAAAAADLGTELAAAVLAATAEGSTTVAGILSLIAAAVQGDASGLEGAAQTFKGLDGTTTRIVATYASGTRAVSSRTPV